MEKLDIDHMWGVNRLDFHHTLVSGVPWVRGGVQALFPEQQLVIQLRSWRGYNIPVSLVQNNYLWEYWNSAQDEMSGIILLICERYHFILKNNFVFMQHPLYIIFFFTSDSLERQIWLKCLWGRRRVWNFYSGLSFVQEKNCHVSYILIEY